jgi:hypothetical protein
MPKRKRSSSRGINDELTFLAIGTNALKQLIQEKRLPTEEPIHASEVLKFGEEIRNAFDALFPPKPEGEEGKEKKKKKKSSVKDDEAPAEEAEEEPEEEEAAADEKPPKKRKKASKVTDEPATQATSTTPPGKKKTPRTPKKTADPDEDQGDTNGTADSATKSGKTKPKMLYLCPCGSKITTSYKKGRHKDGKDEIPCWWLPTLSEFPFCICGYVAFPTAKEWCSQKPSVEVNYETMRNHLATCEVYAEKYNQFNKDLQCLVSNPYKLISSYGVVDHNIENAEITKEMRSVMQDVQTTDKTVACIGCWTRHEDQDALKTHITTCSKFDEEFILISKQLWCAAFAKYAMENGAETMVGKKTVVTLQPFHFSSDQSEEGEEEEEVTIVPSMPAPAPQTQKSILKKDAPQPRQDAHGGVLQRPSLATPATPLPPPTVTSILKTPTPAAAPTGGGATTHKGPGPSASFGVTKSAPPNGKGATIGNDPLSLRQPLNLALAAPGTAKTQPLVTGKLPSGKAPLPPGTRPPVGAARHPIADPVYDLDEEDRGADEEDIEDF